MSEKKMDSTTASAEVATRLRVKCASLPLLTMTSLRGAQFFDSHTHEFERGTLGRARGGASHGLEAACSAIGVEMQGRAFR